MIRTGLVALMAAGLLLGLGFRPARADELPEKYKQKIERGLKWLVKQQQRDGHFGANGDQFPVTMTSLAGMAFLMEGSTLRDGKYKDQLTKITDWLMDRSMKDGARNGLIGNPDHPSEAGRYMYGHGFAMLFLACVYGEEEDRERRDRLKDILTRAVVYCGKAQSSYGGWYYTAKGDNNQDQDEGSVTATQVQGLRACRNAGIAVPKKIIEMAQDYLKKSTTQRGGVIYSLGRGNFAPLGGERPALTAAAIATAFNSGEYKNPLVKKWFEYCQTALPLNNPAIQRGHDEYTHYYYAQALYMLGDDGWEKLVGHQVPVDQRITWTAYRKNYVEHLYNSQNEDGSWNSGGGFSVGTVYSTSIYLCILQLEKAVLPIYQR
jgi:hypothetical protein